MKPSGIDIRPAYEGDQERLAEIFAITYRATFPMEPAEASSPDRYREIISGETQYRAAMGGIVLGFVSVFWPDNFIHSLYVHPTAQGRGLGRALVDYVLVLGRGPIELKTDAVANPALGFYRRLGFREVGAGKSEAGEWRRLRHYGFMP